MPPQQTFIPASRSRHALPRLGEAVAECEAWAGAATQCADGVVFKHDDAEALRHAEAIRAALAGPETEHVRDLRRSLSRFIGPDEEEDQDTKKIPFNEGSKNTPSKKMTSSPRLFTHTFGTALALP